MSTDPTDPTNAELAARFDAHEKKDEERHKELLDAVRPTWTFDSKTLAGIVALIGAITSLVTALGLGGTGQATAGTVHVVEQAQHAPAPDALSTQEKP